MNDDSRLQIERYLRLINRRKWVMIIPVVLAVSAAALISYLTAPTYEASATARVDISSQDASVQDVGPADRYINTYAAIIKTNGFLDRVISDLGLKTDANALKKRVTTTRVAGTELVQIKATAHSADEAAAIANDFTNLLRDPTFVAQFVPDTQGEITAQVDRARAGLLTEQARLNTTRASGTVADVANQQAVVDAAQTRLDNLIKQAADAAVRQSQAARGFTVVEPATRPAAPTSPRWTFNLAAGLLAGVVAGLAVAFVLEYLDPTLRRARDLESVTMLPVLASIPYGIRWKYPPPPLSPEYRLLATKLSSALREKQYRSVLFTSARPDEGNTTAATYTAMAMAQSGMRVLLVDGNLTRPDLHRMFNLPIAPGLYNFISSNGARPTEPIPVAAQQTIHSSPVQRLSVLTAGTKVGDPAELLASTEMRGFLEYLESQWDAVLIDGASMAESAGSAVIAPIVDGVVLVTAEGQASRASVEETLGELASLGGHSIGIVYCKATER